VTQPERNLAAHPAQQRVEGRGGVPVPALQDAGTYLQGTGG
jgi:hypothetical protein